MAVKLRLKRFGRRHKPYFRIAAMDIRRPRDGRTVEELGIYNPNEKEAEKQVRLERERIEYWLKVGAQPSDTVRSLLKRSGIAVKA